MDSSFSKTAAGTPGAPPAENELAASASPATQRFLSCRWRKAAENALPEHCTHRDVLPMAGTAGFQPDSWCADCAFYKAKRTPRKREEPPPDPWRRW